MTSKNTTPGESPHESDSTADNSTVPPPPPSSAPERQGLEGEETVAAEAVNSSANDAGFSGERDDDVDTSDTDHTAQFEVQNTPPDDSTNVPDNASSADVIDHINELPVQYRPVPPIRHEQTSDTGGYSMMPGYQPGPPRNNFPYQPEHPASPEQYQSSDNTGFALVMMIILSLVAVGIFSVLALLIYRLFFGG